MLPEVQPIAPLVYAAALRCFHGDYLSRFALKPRLYASHIVRDDGIVFVSVFPISHTAVTIGTDSCDVERMISSPIRQRADMMDFEIWLSVAAHKRCRMFTALTISS